jgi:hypothetical protein
VADYVHLGDGWYCDCGYRHRVDCDLGDLCRAIRKREERSASAVADRLKASTNQPSKIMTDIKQGLANLRQDLAIKAIADALATLQSQQGKPSVDNVETATIIWTALKAAQPFLKNVVNIGEI